MELIGWQIVARGSDDPAPGTATFEVFPLEDCLRWLDRADRGRWRLLPVYKGDIEMPVQSRLIGSRLGARRGEW